MYGLRKNTYCTLAKNNHSKNQKIPEIVPVDPTIVIIDIQYKS